MSIKIQGFESREAYLEHLIRSRGFDPDLLIAASEAYDKSQDHDLQADLEEASYNEYIAND